MRPYRPTQEKIIRAKILRRSSYFYCRSYSSSPVRSLGGHGLIA